MEPEFHVNDFVWAKMRGYPAWPARVAKHPKGVQGPSNRHYVFFYGTHQHAWMAPCDLYPYFENKESLYKPCQRKGYAEAVWEIEEDPQLKITSAIKTPKGKILNKKSAPKAPSPSPSKSSRKRKTPVSPRTPTPTHLPGSVKKERLDLVEEMISESPLPAKQKEEPKTDSQQSSDQTVKSPPTGVAHHRYATRRRNAPEKVGIVEELKQNYSARKEQPPLTSPIRRNPPNCKATSPVSSPPIRGTSISSRSPPNKTPPISTPDKPVKGKQSNKKPTTHPQQTTRLTRRSLRFQGNTKTDETESQGLSNTCDSILSAAEPSQTPPPDPTHPSDTVTAEPPQKPSAHTDAQEPSPPIANATPPPNEDAHMGNTKSKSGVTTRKRRGVQSTRVGSRSSSRLKIKKEMNIVDNQETPHSVEEVPKEADSEREKAVVPSSETPPVTSDTPGIVTGDIHLSKCVTDVPTEESTAVGVKHTQVTASMNTDIVHSTQISDSVTKTEVASVESGELTMVEAESVAPADSGAEDGKTVDCTSELVEAESVAPADSGAEDGKTVDCTSELVEAESVAPADSGAEDGKTVDCTSELVEPESVAPADSGAEDGKTVDCTSESNKKELSPAVEASYSSEEAVGSHIVRRSEASLLPVMEMLEDQPASEKEPSPVTELKDSCISTHSSTDSLPLDDTPQVKVHDESEVVKRQSDENEHCDDKVKGQSDQVKTGPKLRPKRRIKNANLSEDSPLKKFKVSEPTVKGKSCSRHASSEKAKDQRDKGTAMDTENSAPEQPTGKTSESGKGSSEQNTDKPTSKSVEAGREKDTAEGTRLVESSDRAEQTLAKEQPQCDGSKELEKDTVRKATLPELPPFITPVPGMSPVQVLQTYNYNLKAALTVEAPNMPRALETLKKLKDVYCSAADVNKVSDIVATIKKLKRYRASPQVMEGAEEVYQKFKNLAFFPQQTSRRKVKTASRVPKKAPDIMIDYIRTQNSLANRPPSAQNKSGITNVVTKCKPTAKQLKAANTPVVPEKPVKQDEPVTEDVDLENGDASKAEAPPTRSTRSSSAHSTQRVNYEDMCKDSAASDVEMDQTVPS